MVVPTGQTGPVEVRIPTGAIVAEIESSDVISQVVIVTPKSFEDPRGRFVESYRRSWFPHGREMIQGNRSDKTANSLVGLHYHLHQADYWYVTRGLARVVLHDLRVDSPTDGATLTLEIGDGAEQGIFVPPGVAHGFAALTDLTLTYLVDNYYNPDDELGVAWDDKEIAAEWGLDNPIVSDRDKANPTRHAIAEALRPRFPLRME
ncbi:MAG: dTDP-4-dehydrorhamnose 3,5-epimerase-like enzyme [Acidimicrobiaceae bacterium]|nr:dTDP-4-dehydrorhamnose 3,5-epimerase-like enzyme [Acidimicrobiaceae bacterium]